MKKNYFLAVFFSCALVLFGNSKTNAQLTILTPNDTAVCGPITLRAATTVIPANVVNPVDDDYAPHTSAIGFSFVFYNRTYTRCLVSSNGYVSFNLEDSNDYSAWSLQPTTNTNGPIPDSNISCLNSICGVYEDLYLVNSGTIETYTAGVAPYRKFVINFCTCPMYITSLGCNQIETFQIILYETTNNIEVHIKNKHTCSAWNGGLAIEGVQDSSGTHATPAPGRDCTVWTATNDAYRFVPYSIDSYTVASIPFAPIPDVTPGTVYWYQGTTLLGTGTTITVSPTATTTYTAMFASSNCSYTDTFYQNVEILISPGMAIRDIVTLPTTCGACNGSIELLGMTPNSNDSIRFMKNSVWQPSIIYSTSSDSIGVIPNLCAGDYDSIVAYTPTNCPSNVIGPITLPNPVLIASFTDSINFGCNGDTVIFTNNSTAPGATTKLYTWEYGDGSTDTTSTTIHAHIYKTQGIYMPTLVFTNTYCTDSIPLNTNLRHALHAGFNISENLLCQGQSEIFTNTSVDTTRNGIAPSYSWYFGDGSTSTSYSPSYVYGFEDTGNYTPMLIVQDFVPCYDTAYKTIDVINKPIIYNMDSGFCSPNTTIPIGMVISNADSYLWTTGAITPTIIPDTEGVYTVTETNYCGSIESSVKVTLYDCDKCLFIPSAFTPNDDGLNDVFHVRMLCPIRNYGIKIFNRYGQLVYASYYVSQGWDGKYNGVPVDIGTYLYEVTYTPDLPNARLLSRKGDVTVVR
jgi:gliding motility-associated-like protein